MKYFVKEEPNWRISPAIRQMAQFREFNLLGDLRPLGRFDIVFCRNVLIYFNGALTGRVHRLLYESLATSGLMALGNRESIRFTPYEACYEELDGREKIYRRIK